MDFDFSQEAITPDNQPYIKINTTGALGMPVGTTAQQPGSPALGFMRYNTDTPQWEYWNGSAWTTFGGSGAATNLAGGAANELPYQTGVGATSFLGTGTAGQVLVSGGASSPPVWTAATYVVLQSGSTSLIAAANTTAIQTALNAGGWVMLQQVGNFVIQSSLIIKSNTKLTLGPNTQLTLLPTSTTLAMPMLITNQFNTWQTGGMSSVTYTWTSGNSYATINWTSHGLTVGQYVWVQGATPTEFTGIFPVTTVTDANHVVVQLLRVPTSAPSGTIVATAADQNITVEGGIWNYNYPTNSNAYSITGSTPNSQARYNGYTIILAGQNVNARAVEVINVQEYGLCMGAVRDYGIDRFNYPAYTPTANGGAIVVNGPAISGRINNVTVGGGHDDLIALITHFNSTWSAYQWTTGDIVSCEVNTVDGYTYNSGTSIITVYIPTASQVMEDIVIRNIAGRSVGGAGVKVYALDASATMQMGSLTVDGVNVCCLQAVYFSNAATSGTIQNAILKNITNNPESNSSNCLALDVGFNVNNLDVEITTNVPTWPTSGAGYLVYNQGTYQLSRFKFNVISGGNSYAGNVRCMQYTATANVATSVCEIHDSTLPNAYSDYCVLFVAPGAPSNYGQFTFNRNQVYATSMLYVPSNVILTASFNDNNFAAITNGVIYNSSGGLVTTKITGHNLLTSGSIWTTNSGTLTDEDTVIAIASEALSAGAWVTLYNSSGSLRAQNSNATSAGSRTPVHGYVAQAAASSSTAVVFLNGTNTNVSGMTVGSTVYLSTTNGVGTVTPPSGAGNIVQRLGVATSATSVMFEPGDAIVPGTNITLTESNGTMTIAAAGGVSGVFPIVVVSGTAQTAVAGNQYMLENAASTAVTMPATGTQGDTVLITTANGRSDNTVIPNSNNIGGQSATVVLDIPYYTTGLQFVTGTGWVIMGSSNGAGSSLQLNQIQGLGLEYNAGNSGSAITVNWSNGFNQLITLTANTTITLGTPPLPGRYQLRLVQNGSNSYTVAYAGSAYSSSRWIGTGSAPAVNTNTNGETIISLFYNGSTFTQGQSTVGY